MLDKALSSKLSYYGLIPRPLIENCRSSGLFMREVYIQDVLPLYSNEEEQM